MPGRLIVQVYLTAARLRLSWAAGLHRGGTEIIEEALAPQAGTPRWLAAVKALENQIRVHAWKRFELRVFVGDENLRYALVPALEVHLGIEELARLAQSILVRTYGEAARDWTVRLTAAGKSAVLVAALDSALVEALRELTVAADARLRTICPAFLRLAEVAGGFASRTNSWVLALEPAAAVAGLWEGTELRTLRIRRTSGGDLGDIGPWLERERLRADSDVRSVLLCGESPEMITLPAGWDQRDATNGDRVLQPLRRSTGPVGAAATP